MTGGAGSALYAAMANAYTPATIAGTLDSVWRRIHAALRAAIEDTA